MPRVGDKHFPYTKAGKMAARVAKKRLLAAKAKKGKKGKK